MILRNLFFCAFGMLFCCMSDLSAIFPINILRPYDELFYIGSHGETFQLYGVAEHGFKSQGRSEDAHRVEPFQLWQCSQNSLAMLKGFAPSTPQGQFLQQFGTDFNDGRVGHVVPHADVEYTGGVISGRWYVPYDISLSVHIPIYTMEVKNVCWSDLTPENDQDRDILVKDLLTSQLEQRVQEFGNLRIGGWKKTGLGDVVFAARWLKQFPQIKPLLRTVTLHVGGGLSVPTTKCENICQALDIFFGNEGSAGLFVHGGIDLQWNYHLRAGIDAFFMHLFGSSKERRIKINASQTDLLLLQTAPSRRDFSLTQRYNIFLEANRIVRGLSLRATYQFWQHGGDELSLKTNAFSSAIASTARRYDDWTMHNMIFTLLYDTQEDFSPTASVTPQFSLYYKLPLNGSNSMLMHGVGGAVVLNF